MPHDKDVNHTQPDDQPHDRGSLERRPRRRLLTLLAGGTVAAGGVPARWTKPVASAVLLPAHAQTTSGGGPPVVLTECAGITIDMQWSGNANGTLVIREPGGVVVGPTGTIENKGMTVLTGVSMMGSVFAHLGDAPAGPSGSETIVSAHGAAMLPGRYDIGVGFDDTEFSVTVRCGQQPVFSSTLPAGRQGFSADLEVIAYLDVSAEGDVEVSGAAPSTIF